MSNRPCEEYGESGNPWNQYIMWANENGYFMKKYNVCGSSNIIKIKKWKKNPFEILIKNEIAINTTKIKYPLSFDKKDSVWFETKISHYKYYNFSFPNNDVRDIEIKKYAFRKSKEDDQIRLKVSNEFKKNKPRYEYNNRSIIKEILDSILSITTKQRKKLQITNANSGSYVKHSLKSVSITNIIFILFSR